MESIKLANDSEFELGASLWTEDLDKAERDCQEWFSLE
jgi:acyl-CoA reductase-like NAD-dependent aldehyde dehydrogenase